jgi:hypothetical protein
MPRERPALSDVRFFSEKWGYVGNPLPVVLDRDILPGIQTAVCQVRVNGAAIQRYWNAPGLTQRGSETSVSERGQNGSLYSTTLGVRAERPWAKLPKSLWHLRIHSSAKPRVRQIRPKSIREKFSRSTIGKMMDSATLREGNTASHRETRDCALPQKGQCFSSVSEREVSHGRLICLTKPGPIWSVDFGTDRILRAQPPTIPPRQIRPIGPHFLVRALVALPIEHRRSPGFGALSPMMPIQIFRERF